MDNTKQQRKGKEPKNKDLINQLDVLEREYNIERETLLVLLEDAMQFAARKAAQYNKNIVVSIDRVTYNIKCMVKLYVVNTVEDPGDEIALDNVKELFSNHLFKVMAISIPGEDTTIKDPVEIQSKIDKIDLGTEIEIEFSPDFFGRVFAQTVWNLFCQRIRQTQRRKICSQYQERLNQLVAGEVRSIDREGVMVGFQLGNASANSLTANPRHLDDEAFLPRDEKIPGENFDIGHPVTALLIEVDPDRQGAAMVISRAKPEFVTKLFEREVSEIGDGTVTIKSIARIPGFRSKIAVTSSEPRVDPVGACVGQRGSRVRNVVSELSGEKVDIIEWNADPTKFIANALKPATIVKISLDEKSKKAIVEVPEDQLSLTIGKRAQNARLASTLTGWRIEVQKSEAPVEVNEFEAGLRKAIETIGTVEAIGPEAAEILVKNGFSSLEGIAAVEDVKDIADLEGFDTARANTVIAAAKAALQQ
ncbi:MAG: transcription termination factor NusA [Victivallales bacterium]|jgi:N utilization substance protein A|nr:transcription termination factor NusA [Victivallales bacterium]